MLLFLLVGCQKPELDPVEDTFTVSEVGDANSLPTVHTLRVDGRIGEDTIVVTGSVDRHGGSWITERGICYGTAPDPVWEPGHIIVFPVDDQGILGEFAVPFPGASSPMYVRAYAINSAGTAYGAAMLLTLIRVHTDSILPHSENSVRVFARVEGNGTVAERGICYSSGGQLPTLNDMQVQADPDTGGYSCVVPNLMPGVRYHVRAYAREGNGTITYGDTLAYRPRLCPDSIQDVSGNWYHVVEINNRCWTKENLRSEYYPDNSLIPFESNSGSWVSTFGGSRCAPNGNTSNTETYGWLYNWYAVSDPRKVCPEGWKVPTKEDWLQLNNSFSATELMDTTWDDGTNSTGFSGTGAGMREAAGDYSGFLSVGGWWSSSEVAEDTSKAYSFKIDSIPNSLVPQLDKNSGLSIRCIKSP